ncbi:MAG: phenylalanine--tRNA ligase subunit beta, partial [Mycoplasmataceae bacterium]|nr:phenylalanine--tRNA ligase subunit beta [Mycoplasmataceae bacterium]
MLFSHKELRRLASLDKNITLNQIINAINSIGFEVEGTEKFADIEGVKFGLIEKITKNPNADTLNVCDVKFEDKNRIIQTNASNVFEGMMVLAFIPGARSGKMIFAAKELRGIVSEGMLSSLNEFNINKDLIRNYKDGIQAYKGFEISDDPIETLGLDDDVIDVSILSNRPDASSYLIMARELAAYFGTIPLDLSQNQPTLKTNIISKKGGHKDLILIEAKNDFVISMKEQVLLYKHNIKSISDIVDLTNLTLIYSGQPTHAYDKNKVGTIFSSIITSTKVNIFGNKEVMLKDSLVITSDNKEVSLAGVIGFEETGVSKNTKSFILELGRFNIKNMRESLKMIKISTNAGIQSSKNISQGILELAIQYLSSKLITFSSIVGLNKNNEQVIKYSDVELSKVIGIDITKDNSYKKVITSLETLGFKLNGNKLRIPSYRGDMETQQDINEEFIRFYGLDNIIPIAPKIASFKVSKINPLETIAASKGYNEVVTYSLISNENNIYNPFLFDKSITLETFVSRNREVIRDSQITSLLEVIEYNQKRKMNDLNIFSIGMINNGVKSLAIASTTKTFEVMKHDVINLLPSGVEFVKTTNKILHPGLSADILLDGKLIAYLGKIHPKLTKINAFIFETININKGSSQYK